METLPYSEALETILANCPQLPCEDTALDSLVGRILPDDLIAQGNDPPAAKSSMDGFAVSSGSTTGASPENPLQFSYDEVVGAGHIGNRLEKIGQAVRIMTGAWIPEGVDAVVKIEDTREEASGRFSIARPLKPGENVIPAGSFLAKGQLLIEAGSQLNPQRVGILAGQGISRARVYRQPRVALLALGDELTEPGEPLKPGHLYVSNIYGLAAECRRYGAESERLGIAGDDPQEIESRLRPLLETDAGEGNPPGCDMVITLGGSHFGDFDFAADVLTRLGTRVHFRQTDLNIGGSTLFATHGKTLFFGLPGTPGASWLAFQVLVRPALWRLSGRTSTHNPLFQARLKGSLSLRPLRTSFIPALVNLAGEKGPEVTPLIRERRGILPGGVLANGLIHGPSGGNMLEDGEEVSVELLG